MNGESEKCLVQRAHGEDGTRENVPSPGRIISVSFTFPLRSSVILEFPAISKSVSDFTEEWLVLGASTGPCEVVAVDAVVVVAVAAVVAAEFVEDFVIVIVDALIAVAAEIEALLVVVAVVVIVVVTVEVLVLIVAVVAVVVLN